jgi:hypothetical protein
MRRGRPAAARGKEGEAGRRRLKTLPTGGSHLSARGRERRGRALVGRRGPKAGGPRLEKKEGRKMGRWRKWAGLDRFFPSLFSLFSFLFFSNQFFKSFLNQIFYIFSNSNFHTNFSNYF